MNIEERAENVMSIFRCMLIETIDGQVLTGIDLMNRIAEALRDQVEDCAKKADEEVLRLDRLSMEHNRKGDLDTATRFSACTVTAARLGREIRALAGPTLTEERKEIEK